MLARHHNLEPQQIELAGSGTGGITELINALDDGNTFYGLRMLSRPWLQRLRPPAHLTRCTLLRPTVRVTEQIDMSTTVKFVYIYFQGEGVPFTKRGRMGVVHGNIRKNFQVCLRERTCAIVRAAQRSLSPIRAHALAHAPRHAAVPLRL